MADIESSQTHTFQAEAKKVAVPDKKVKTAMPPAKIRLTRKELYEEIWNISVTGVSKKYGIRYAKFSCLHFGQNNGKLISSVSDLILIRVLFPQTGQ